MRLELIEEVGTTRIGKYSWEDPDGQTGGNQLYGSFDGAKWVPIESYTVERSLLGDTRIIFKPVVN